MKHPDEQPGDINPDKETAETNRLHMQPGAVEDIENASAYANRTDQSGVTGMRPERARLNDDLQAEQRMRSNPPATDARQQDDPDDQPPLTTAANPLA